MAHLLRGLLKLWRDIKIVIGRDLYFPVECKCRKEYHGTLLEGYAIVSGSLDENSIVYSLGVGEDISFDLSIIEKYDCDVFAFDPTPRSINWIKTRRLSEKFKFFEFGIADFDGEARFHPHENGKDVSYSLIEKKKTGQNPINIKVHRLKSIMEILGHKRIDLLKMDIEGTEYEVINEVLSSDIDVGQIILEFHHRFSNIGPVKTRNTVIALRRKGYMVFDASHNEGVFSFVKK